jgi:hypothetical protein
MLGASGAIVMIAAVGSAASLVVGGDAAALAMSLKAFAEILDFERYSLSFTDFRIDSVEHSVFCTRIVVGIFLKHLISHCPNNVARQQ